MNGRALCSVTPSSGKVTRQDDVVHSGSHPLTKSAHGENGVSQPGRNHGFPHVVRLGSPLFELRHDAEPVSYTNSTYHAGESATIGIANRVAPSATGPNTHGESHTLIALDTTLGRNGPARQTVVP